jgi:hypothetical protein
LGEVAPYVSVEISDSYDKIFHNRVQGQISLNFAFGPKVRNKPGCPSPCCDPLTLEDRLALLPTQRQEIIVLDDHRKRHRRDVLAFDPSDGPLDFIFVNNTNNLPMLISAENSSASAVTLPPVPNGNGTFENPFNTLLAAQMASKVGSIIYVYQGDGTTTGMDAGYLFQDNQSVLGAGIPQPVLTQFGIIVIPPMSPGNPSVTNSTDGAHVFTFANNDRLSGFNISKANTGHIIVGTSMQNATIVNNVIDETSVNNPNSAIVFQNLSGASIFANNIITGNNVGAFGIYVQNSLTTVGSVAVFNNNITGWMGIAGIYFLTSDTAQINGAVTGNYVSNPVASGFNGSGFRADLNNNSSVNAFISNNIFNMNSDTGIACDLSDSCSLNIAITNNQITNTVHTLNGNGIEFDFNSAVTAQIAITGNTITGNGKRGIEFNYPGLENSVVHAFVSQNTISGNAQEGIAGQHPLSGAFAGSFTSNQFSGNGGVADVSLGYFGNASACIQFNSNTSTNNFIFTNFIPGTFNLETPVGNVGSITLNGPGPIIIVPPGTCEH